MHIPAARWQQIRTLFDQALEREPSARAGFLAEMSGDDADLRQEVESLLNALEQADDFLEQPAERSLSELLGDVTPSMVGRRVGSYDIRREIGVGGMGAVYEAVRADDQYQKRVAIKLIRRGMDSELAIRRFRHERQILASLDHPNIAGLLDGGVTEDGQPYFVMEYVEGQSITSYCDDRRLPVRERLALFRQVCEAVQYAHRNLVVHRDLKPSNILVTTDGTVKLLDFGVAKLLRQDDSTGGAPLTRRGIRVFTPEYASPEQIRGAPITTSCDIYSLGVVLYELLTGRHPFQFENLSLHEIESIICEDDPPKPSAAVTAQSAQRLGERPSKLRGELGGELDSIVMMAMRKEPERRYASVEQLSNDVRRYLEGRPITAQRDWAGYRARKFIRRNKAAVAASTLLVASLIGGIITTSAQARRAERRFNDVRKLANTFLFDFHDAIVNLPGSTPARELVVRTALTYLSSLSREATGDRALQHELAKAYLKVGDVLGNPQTPNLGDLRAALQNYRRALTLTERILASEPNDRSGQRTHALALSRIGDVLMESGDVEGALASYRSALAIAEVLGADTADLQAQQDLMVRLNKVGLLLARLGKTGEALEMNRRAFRIAEAVAAAAPRDAEAQRDLMISHNRVGDGLARAGDTRAALEHYRRGLAIAERLARADSTNAQAQHDLTVSHYKIGDVLQRTGEYTEALASFRRMLAINQRLAAADPRDARAGRNLMFTYAQTGNALAQTGDIRAGLEDLRRALAQGEALAAAHSENTDVQRDLAQCLDDISKLLIQTGDLGGALAHDRRALEIRTRLAEADPENLQVQRDLSLSFNKLGQVLELMGDHRGALAYYSRGLTLAKKLAAADSNDMEAQRDLSTSLEKVGSALEKTGDLPGALARYDSSLSITQRLAAADPDNVQAQADLARGHQMIGSALVKTGERREAGTHFRSALVIRRSLARRRSASWQDVHEYASLLVTVPLETLRDPAEAVAYARRAVELTGGSVPAVQHTLARAHFESGDVGRAVRAAERALALLRDRTPGASATAALRRDIEASLAQFRAARRRSAAPTD